MIRHNAHKYLVSAMCDVLQIPRSSYYYHLKIREDDERQAQEVDLQELFMSSSNKAVIITRTRKIKEELEKQNKIVSIRRISCIMKHLGLVSNYTAAYFKPQKNRSNEALVANVLNREFEQDVYKALSSIKGNLTNVQLFHTDRGSEFDNKPNDRSN